MENSGIMENSKPKDVPFTEIEKVHVYRTLTDALIFNAFNVDVAQEYKEQQFRATCDVSLTLQGEVTYIGAKQLHEVMEDNESVSFDIYIKRTDVIEILKYGQFIKMKGRGLISSISGNIDFKTIVIRVYGNITIG